jgi:hypothetical protein
MLAKSNSLNLNHGGAVIEQVPSFKYLGRDYSRWEPELLWTSLRLRCCQKNLMEDRCSWSNKKFSVCGTSPDGSFCHTLTTAVRYGRTLASSTSILFPRYIEGQLELSWGRIVRRRPFVPWNGFQWPTEGRSWLVNLLYHTTVRDNRILQVNCLIEGPQRNRTTSLASIISNPVPIHCSMYLTIHDISSIPPSRRGFSHYNEQVSHSLQIWRVAFGFYGG